MIEKPITIVLAGGTSLPKGFAGRFKAILERSNFPIAVGEIITASNPVNAVSNGALVAALSDSENQ
jgi:actin-related protein